jgi:NAD(P)H-hydrate epimerase
LGLVDAVNAARQDAPGPLVLSLDLPSGMHADRGVPKGWENAIVRADVTATFAAIKPGLLARGATSYRGAVVPVSLGVPETLYRLARARRV